MNKNRTDYELRYLDGHLKIMYNLRYVGVYQLTHLYGETYPQFMKRINNEQR